MDGNRLMIARVASELTQTKLAALTGISQGTISKAETGALVLTPAQLSAISSATGFPESYFTDEPIQVARGQFRKASKVTSSKQNEVRAKSAAIADVLRVADRTYNLLNVTIASRNIAMGNDEARNVGTEIRSVLGIPQSGPVPNVTRALERGGIAVTALPGYVDAGSKRFDGFSFWPGMGVEGLRPLVVASVMDRGDVWRSTVAHELGHLILHTRFPSVDTEVAEEQAWAFANGFLFPLEDARTLFDGVKPTLSSLLKVKSVYGVSVAFLVKCLRSYEIIDDARSTSLWRQMSARGWRGAEPGEVVMERPKLLPTILKRMISDGVQVGLPAIMSRQLIALAT